MALRFGFEPADTSVRKILTDYVDLPARPMVGDEVLVTVQEGERKVLAALTICRILWLGIPIIDYEETVGTLYLKECR